MINFNYAVLMLFMLITYTTTAEPILASLYYNKVSGTYTVKTGIYDTDAIAYAKFTPSYEDIGWDYLTLSSYIGNDKSKYKIMFGKTGTIGKTVNITAITEITISGKFYYLLYFVKAHCVHEFDLYLG